ncbi:hypothetical protein HOD30_05100 [Candidatus Peregrinibacteria bacterium]|jgi:hypothetical protein|nr:hypothetical protein [Candidatus Peregrinibacteria bacterium]MBT4631401.1 hypothetical protein [Candidatus Peregrinibacteria bacterium]MBT5517107.1 hypothetical protein [Candidatus Peregrinibacteria bacterium]MBT5824013.1 hypothetical protein [Candidatus Peregrinibacteria bacterium]
MKTRFVLVLTILLMVFVAACSPTDPVPSEIEEVLPPASIEDLGRPTGPELTPEQLSAETRCEELGGTARIELSMSYNAEQTFCAFDDGECTQTELNDGVCYAAN